MHPSFNLTCVEIANDTLSLLVSQSVGPRVLSLRYCGGENLFAELPDFTAPTPAGLYHFYGGHRLWRAPEDIALTYQPDDTPVAITPIENGLLVVKPIEMGTGLQKSLRITLESARVFVEHTLTNQSQKSVACAPWAITQLKAGGIAILPQSTAQTGLLPNRQIAFWPYTDIRSAHITWGNQYTLVHANMTEGALKVGFPNPRGWLAYWLAGTLFIKKVAFDPQAQYLDNGSSSECFCNDKFLELETLGGITHLSPGATVQHVETWEVFGDVAEPLDETAIEVMAKKLDLD